MMLRQDRMMQNCLKSNEFRLLTAYLTQAVDTKYALLHSYDCN
jgi:hypothetical protein